MTDECKGSCGCGSDNSCCGDRSGKLCKLTKHKFKFDIEKIKNLTNNAQFICKCCGRLANDKENLCSPTYLK